MSCTVEFLVHSNEGAPSLFKLEVPDVSEMSLEDAIGALMGNVESYNDFINAVNSGGFPITALDSKNLGKDGLPIGNYNLNTIKNEFPTPNITYLVDKLQGEGEDLNRNNILLTNARFSLAWNTNYGIFRDTSGSLAVIKPKEEYIETYLKQRYVNTVLDKAPKEQVQEVNKNIESALKMLAASNDTSSRVQTIMKYIGYDFNTNSIHGNVIPAFVNYFYTSATFNDALYKNGLVSKFNELFNQIIGTPTTEIPSYSDTTVQALVDRAEVSGNYLRISKKDMQDFMDAYSYGELSDESIVSTIQDLNNKIDNEKFLDIAFISDGGILLRNTFKQPEFDKTIVNTEYSGELIEPIETVGGYNIAKYNDRYYIDSRIVTTSDGLKGAGVDNLKYARSIANKLLDRPIDLKSVTSKLKNGSLAIQSYQSLQIGDRFSVLDVELNDNIKLYNDKDLVKNITFNNFISELNKKPQYKKLISILKEQGLNIESILNTQEKLETFFLLKNQLRDPDIHASLYNSKVPSMLTQDKLDYELQLMTEALNIIQNATESVYEVTGANGDKYSFRKLESERSVPVHKKVPRSFKSEMVEIANHLSKNYGINVNVVTAREIASKFRGVIPNAGRTNAFIYNGEVYLNVDRATTADSLHEFAHLIMGSMKRTNPGLYYGLVEQVESLANYDDKLEAFRMIGDTRAVPDLNEEIFVTEFGNYFARIAEPWFEGKEASLEEMGRIFKEKTQKTFQTSDDIKNEKLGRLLNMSIDNIMSEFGSALINNDLAAGFDMNLASESRTITNLIQKLIKSGNLKENC